MNFFHFTAIFGTFDANMKPLVTTDVTSIITKKFMKGKKIIIPYKINFSRYFGLITSAGNQFLQFRFEKRTHNIAVDEYSYDIEVDIEDAKKHIKLIYYAYISRSSNWKTIISGQLGDLKRYGIFDDVELYIHITDITNKFEDVISIINEICGNAIISTSTDNQFEYPGLKLLYDLSKRDPDSIYIYLHTKGMSYNIQERKVKEVALLAGTFRNWRKNIQIFNDPAINKLGLFPGRGDLINKEKFGTEGGWIWYNFWYARGSYIVNNCLEPVVKEDRFYFEVWLAGPALNTELKRITDCYSLCNGNCTTYVDAMEAWAGLNVLSGIWP